jgi:hypothetical protein
MSCPIGRIGVRSRIGFLDGLNPVAERFTNQPLSLQNPSCGHSGLFSDSFNSRVWHVRREPIADRLEPVREQDAHPCYRYPER